MKLFGRYHIYILISTRKIPAEKLRDLRQGIIHLHRNPIRKDLKSEMPIDPPTLPLPFKEIPEPPNTVDPYIIRADMAIPGVPIEEFR